MITGRQLDANRQNARESTGPRTTAGKARSSQNARRHGLTAPVEASQISLWLRVILGEPHVEPHAALSGGDRMTKALTLARAESDFARCDAALRRHRAGLVEEKPLPQTELSNPGHAQLAEKALRLEQALLAEIGVRTSRDHARTERLLMRYRQQAFSRRKRAFRDWITELKQPSSSA